MAYKATYSKWAPMGHKVLSVPPRSYLRSGFYLILALLTASVSLHFLVPHLLGEQGQGQGQGQKQGQGKGQGWGLGQEQGQGKGQGWGLTDSALEPARGGALSRRASLFGFQLPGRKKSPTVHLPVPKPKPGISQQGKGASGVTAEGKGTGEGESEGKSGSEGGSSLLRRRIGRGSVLWTAVTAGGVKPLLQGFNLWEALSHLFGPFQRTTERKFEFEDWPNVTCAAESLQEVAANLSSLHHAYNRGDPRVMFEHPIPKVIHQTRGPNVKGLEASSMGAWTNKHPGYEHIVWSDASARAFVARCVPDLLPVYDAAPGGILRSDMLRYLLLFVFGGIWGDADTTPFRVFHNWLDGVEGNPSLANVTLIAAVEEDEGDWEVRRFIRRVQIVQWTMAASPRHPAVRYVVQQMLGDVVSLIRDVYSLGGNASSLNATSSQLQGTNHSTSLVTSHKSQGSSPTGGLLGILGRKGLWEGHWRSRKATEDSTEEEELFTIGPLGPFRLPSPGAKARRQVTKKDILQSTGPGAWTDGIKWALEARGAKMEELVKMEKGKAFRDIVILPITAFSPGVGKGKSDIDPEARVKHWFSGSWKPGVKDE